MKCKKRDTFLFFQTDFCKSHEIFFCEVYCEKAWKPFWFMWSGSTTGLLKVRNIDRVKPFYTFCAVGTIRLGIIILLNRIRYKKDDAMLSKHMYSNLEIQWHTAPDILLFTDTMAHRYSYTVIYKYNGKQVQV